MCQSPNLYTFTNILNLVQNSPKGLKTSYHCTSVFQAFLYFLYLGGGATIFGMQVRGWVQRIYEFNPKNIWAPKYFNPKNWPQKYLNRKNWLTTIVSPPHKKYTTPHQKNNLLKLTPTKHVTPRTSTVYPPPPPMSPKLFDLQKYLNPKTWPP